MESELIKFLIIFPFLGFLLNGLGAKKLFSEKESGIFASLMIGFSFLLAIFLFLSLLRADTFLKETIYVWISAGNFTIPVSLLFDPLSAAMSLVVTGVSFLIHIYSIGYMHGDRGVHRYFSYLNLFVGFMLILVLADNPAVMFIGWEGVGLCSYLLIGFWYENESNAAAGKKAFITNRVGDAGFLVGLMILFYLLFKGGIYSLDFSSIKENVHLIADAEIWGMSAPLLISVLLLLGATGKSAQFPLYVWLPDAMAGPTPVSALIHAATMVTAGAYMLVRMNFIFAIDSRSLYLILVVGCFTALLGAVIAILQKDIKKVLAYSTISQIGYMFMAIGAGACAAGIFHLATHAFFKALLFLGAGSVIHAMAGEQDMFKMGGLSKEMKVTFLFMAVAALAISGIPPFAGFYSKDLILEKIYFSGAKYIWLLASLTAAITAYYIARLIILTFLAKPAGERKVHESVPVMAVPMGFLALLSLVGGYLGSKLLLPFLEPAAETHAHGSGALALVSVLMALIAIGISVIINGKPLADQLKNRFALTYKLIFNKFYVDELYASFIGKPLKWTADNICYIFMDAKLIDGICINKMSRLIYKTGNFLRKVQNGDVQIYALVFMVSLVVLIYFFAGQIG